MGEKILGCDLSKWNGANGVLDALSQYGDIKFVIAKATEGRTYKDQMFNIHMRTALVNNRLIGAYHYARPESGNTPEQEAINYVNAVRPYIGQCLMALDWEDKALTKSNSQWALAWCKAVFAMTGVRPVVYVQESYAKNMTAFAGECYGLWAAKWSKNPPKAEPNWPFWALWQYTNKPFDLDWFNGSAEQFRAYCVSSTVENEDLCDCQCHYCGCCNKGE